MPKSFAEVASYISASADRLPRPALARASESCRRASFASVLGERSATAAISDRGSAPSQHGCIRERACLVPPEATRRQAMAMLIKKVPDWLLLVLLGKAVGTLIFM
jgi:hypothetical protein